MRSSFTDGAWVVFWEVEHLQELHMEDRIRIAHIQGFGRRGPYKRNFAPEGPMLIEHPGATR
ncbi:MAG TPA: hypothetical protein PLU39_03355 [Armatimonadota bacterium]|nr:hypothetical protein [Armatimonadota bacterium]HOJ22316.1 hypothetical protein [Armatimonadota bacterium]HOM80968.1 hypothetical protein [Armatimonadota bacterium]HOQ29896.1 hypothetical protein [Armatimonadota bacterium]HPT96886.1 hypothetical protein [Armatimonadota bacterium]